MSSETGDAPQLEEGGVALHHFEVAVPAFTGPFDVLFGMVQDKQVPIEQLPLADLTSQFLEYIRKVITPAVDASSNSEAAPSLEGTPPPLLAVDIVDTSSEFLVIAAYLVELKSKKLLPAPEILQEEEEVEESLLDHLMMYSSFKEAAKQLFERKQHFEKVFIRMPRPEEIAALPPPEVHLKNVNTGDLLQAFSRVWQQAITRDKGRQIEGDPITVEEKVEEILSRLAQTPHQIKFEELFTEMTRFHVVVTFLSVLELIRLRTIQIVQEETFGQIFVRPRPKEEEGNAGEPAADA